MRGTGVRFESGIQQDIAGLPGQHQVLSTLVFEGNFRGLCRCEELFVEPGFKLMVKLRRRYPQFSGEGSGARRRSKCHLIWIQGPL